MPGIRTDALPPRLGLVAASPGRPSALDGAWWPRSPDLGAEAPSLLAAVGAARGSRAIHLTYDPSIWDPNPGRMYVDGHRVKVGWFRAGDPHQVTVTLINGTRLVLMVVPSEMDANQASWALERSVEPGNVLRPGELLELARLSGRDDGLQRWFGEGGMASRPASSEDGPTAGQARVQEQQ